MRALPPREMESEIVEFERKGKRCPLGKPEADLDMGRVAAPKPPSVRGGWGLASLSRVCVGHGTLLPSSPLCRVPVRG